MKGVRICLIVWGVVSLSFGEMRTWTSHAGQTLDAEYVRESMGKVWLKTADGNVKKIPISGLSQADQDHISSKIPPKIKISVKDNVERGTVGTDIDNVRERVQCEIEISKMSKNPYPGELTAYFFAFGWELEQEEYVLMDSITETFTLISKNDNKYSFKGDLLKFEYDPSPPWGDRFKGYLVCVKTSDGKILASKGNSRYEKVLHILIKERVGARFDEKMRKTESGGKK